MFQIAMRKLNLTMKFWIESFKGNYSNEIQFSPPEKVGAFFSATR